MVIQKNQNPEGRFGATTISAHFIYLEIGSNWQCCLAGWSKTAPRILIISIAMGVEYSFEVKNIEIWEPAFFKHNNSSVATVILL